MSSSTQSQSGGPVEHIIRDKLTAAFHPQHLAVLNESSMHSVPPGSETHFSVVVVSDAFDGVSLIQRHRAVHSALSTELSSGVHALSVTARTPAQWQQSGGSVSKSPACVGGMKAEAEAAARKQNE